MSDNRKYYYLKLKENYFDDDSIVLLESMQDGVLYSNILLKLYLKSLKHGGKLQLDENIPYTAQMIATITRQQIGTVERALQIRAIHDQIEFVINLERALELIERLPSQSRKAFNYEAQITKLEEEIERYQKLKLRLYEDLSDGIIDKAEYFEFRNSYSKIIEDKQEALLRVRKEMKQTVNTGTTERNWVTLFKQYENIEELNRRVLMSLVDRILIYENHVIEIVFKYKDEYQQTLEYVLSYSDELAIAV